MLPPLMGSKFRRRYTLKRHRAPVLMVRIVLRGRHSEFACISSSRDKNSQQRAIARIGWEFCAVRYTWEREHSETLLQRAEMGGRPVYIELTYLTMLTNALLRLRARLPPWMEWRGVLLVAHPAIPHVALARGVTTLGGAARIVGFLFLERK